MFDTFPIRLPSGGKVILVVPEVFTKADAAHVIRQVELIAAHSDSVDNDQERAAAQGDGDA